MFSFLLGGCAFNIIQFQKINSHSTYNNYDRYNPNRNNYYGSSSIDIEEEPTNELDEVVVTPQDNEDQALNNREDIGYDY